MLEVYKSDVAGLRIEHSKKALTTKTSCVIHTTLTDYDIFIRAIFCSPMAHMLGSALSIPCRCVVA